MKTRRKGYNSEHELEKLLNKAGIKAERITLSGQKLHKGDMLIHIGKKRLIGEVKAYKTNFFEYDFLKNAELVFKRTIRKGKTRDFLVVMPIGMFIKLVKKGFE